MSEPLVIAIIGAVGAIVAAIIQAIAAVISGRAESSSSYRKWGFKTASAWFFLGIAASLILAIVMPSITPAFFAKKRQYPRRIVFSPVAALRTDIEVWTGIRSNIQSKVDSLRPKGFCDHEILVILEKPTSYDEQLRKLKSGDIQICSLSAGTTATAVVDPSYHYKPMFELSRKVGQSNNIPCEYAPVFILNSSERQITNIPQLVSELKNNGINHFGFGMTTSHSSYRVPRLVFERVFSMSIPSEEKLDHFGHDTLISRVISGSLRAACVANDILDDYEKKNNGVKVLRLSWQSIESDLNTSKLAYLTNSVPRESFGWNDDLPIPLQLCLEEAFMTYPWNSDNGFKGLYTNSYPEISGVTRLESIYTRWNDVFTAANALKK